MQDEPLEIYCAMFNDFGHRNWWPAETSFETVIDPENYV